VKRDYRKAPSPALGRDMEMLVFGDRGIPVVVFPTSMGRFYQWEDFGMVAHLAPRIDAGLLQLHDDEDEGERHEQQTDQHGQRHTRDRSAFRHYLRPRILS